MFDQEVMVKLRSGVVLGPGRAVDYNWAHCEDCIDIMEYCTVTEQPDLAAAQQLLCNKGYTVIPPLTFDDVAPMTEAPQKGTWYWVTQPFRSQGVEASAWVGDEYDLAALRHRMAYLEREHALIAARHIFGLKGGEL